MLQFDRLHRSLLEDSAISKAVMQLQLPKKSLTGSIGSTSMGFVQDRILVLQVYLKALLSIDGIASNVAFVVFFDFKNKGLSGITTQLGAEKVSMEAFASTNVKGLGIIWVNRFIALLKSGTLVVFDSKYDELEKAVYSISLINDDVEIRPNYTANTNQLDILPRKGPSRGISISLCFDHQLVAADWTTAVADCAAATGEPLFLSDSEDVRRSVSVARKAAARASWDEGMRGSKSSRSTSMTRGSIGEKDQVGVGEGIKRHLL